jgi:hypothetical protein
MAYRVELAKPALGQLGGLPSTAFDALITTMAEVSQYPDEPLRTLPTRDPHVRHAVFGRYGLVTFRIDDAAEIVTVIDVTWTG